MDKCFACSNEAEYILPCYHKICNICLHDLIGNTTGLGELECLYYPNENCDKQCLHKFKQEDVVRISDTSYIDICPKHNEPYTIASKLDDMFYCDKCISPLFCIYTTEEWKEEILTKIEKIKYKLTNKINGLNCIIELSKEYKESESIIKQIEDIIDTMYIDISHIDNFINNIDNIPIPNIIKRKDQLLDNIIIKRKDNINPVASQLRDEIFDKFVKYMFIYGPDINTYDNRQMIWASENGYLNIVKCLIKHGADIHGMNDKAFRVSSENGRLDVVKYLINHGAAINVNSDEAFRKACNNGHVDVVELLIKHGANLHVNNDHALHVSSSKGHLKMVECLIKHGADVQSENNRAIKWASMKCRTSVIELLIKHGAVIPEPA